MPCFRPRQAAAAFNQPLSFDTSRVTNMAGMFEVRSPARALPAEPPSRGSSACGPFAPAAAPRAFRPAHLASYRTPYFRPRQAAAAFNQPVNFNTSRVTNMAGMFLVRSPRVLCPPSPPVAGPPCPRHLRPPLPHAP